MGAEYAIRQCLMAYNQRKREEAYHVYMSDCLSAVARYCGAKVNKRFYDILYPQPLESKKAEDIVSDLTKKMGLKEVPKRDG